MCETCLSKLCICEGEPSFHRGDEPTDKIKLKLKNEKVATQDFLKEPEVVFEEGTRGMG